MTNPAQIKHGALLLVLFSATGCTPWPTSTAPDTLLRLPAPTSDSITLEIFSAQFSFGHADLNGSLWDQIDEQHVPLDTRRELIRNGLRAGVIGGDMPVVLAQLLRLTDQPPKAAEQDTSHLFDVEPQLLRQISQRRSGDLRHITASRIYDHMELLVHEDGQVTGKPLPRAQGIFSARAMLQPDGRVEVSLIPEVHYGDPVRKYHSNQGMMRMETARPREAFEHLRIIALLSPGEMLVIGCTPDPTGSLGRYFLTDRSERGHKQKLIVIRIAGVPPPGEDTF